MPEVVPPARGRLGVVAIVLACLGVAVAVWLVPASVEIVAWPSTGPARVALFASTRRLWLALAVGVVAAAVLHLRPRRLGDGGAGRSVRARVLAPLLLTWLWTVPYWPWLPDRAPVLLVLAGPLRWAIAVVALGGALGVWVEARGWRLAAVPRPGRVGVFLTALTLYAGLGLWSFHTVGLGGDEPQYLIISHSLLVDRDLKIENNHRAGD